MATASGGPTATDRHRPVGYLINHPGGLAGAHGIGYDYVLGSGGLYVQSESAHLTARVLAAPCEVRGLAPVTEKVELAHGPIPAGLFAVGLCWFEDDPGTERFFAVRWDGRSYRLVVPPQLGTATSLAYAPPAGVVAEFHSHGTLPRLLLEDRRQGRAGVPHLRRRRTPRHRPARAEPPGRRLRLLRPGGVAAGLRRTAHPGLRLMAEEPDGIIPIERR